MSIEVSILDKRATVSGSPVIVCGNSDYKIHFTFDEEWADLDAKTARFVYVHDGKIAYQDVVFSGDTVDVPALFDTFEVMVGVFAGDIKTSTPAKITCEHSIRCGTGAPADPTPSQYDQIMALLGAGGGGSVELDPEIFKKDVIISETSLTMTEYGSGSKTAIHSDGKVEIGKTYTVTWNGVKYSCIAKDAGSGYDSVILGNGLAFGLSATDEPFCLRFYNDTELTENVEIFSLEYIATATIEVTTPLTINPKYIPDMYYTEGGSVEILPETTVTGDGEGAQIPFTEPLGLVIGETYIVTVDGVDYECVGKDYGALVGLSGLTVCYLGNLTIASMETEDTGEPFIILDSDTEIEDGMYGMAMITSANTEIVVSVTLCPATIHTIPPKYIKDMYYEENGAVEIISCSGLAINGSKYESIEYYELVAGTEYIVNWRGKEYTCTAVDASSLMSGAVALGDIYTFSSGAGTAIGTTSTGEPFCILKFANANNATGATWLFALDGLTDDLDVIISEKAVVYHTIPEKYIPNSVIAKEINIGEYKAYFQVGSNVGYANIITRNRAIIYEQTKAGKLKFTGVNIQDSEGNILLENITVIFGNYSSEIDSAATEWWTATALIPPRIGDTSDTYYLLILWINCTDDNYALNWECKAITFTTPETTTE